MKQLQIPQKLFTVFSAFIMFMVIMITSSWLEIFVHGKTTRKLPAMNKLDKRSQAWKISIASSKAVINVLAIFMLIHYQLSPASLLKNYSKNVAGPWRDPLKNIVLFLTKAYLCYLKEFSSS